MALYEFLTRDAVESELRPAGKKQLLQDVSTKLAPLVHLHERVIFDALIQRERLGSTGIGNGIAIPHAKFANLAKLTGFFVRLEKAIDFEALDSMPVDLVFVLLAPEGAGADHLKGLAKVARLLRDPARAAKLRQTSDRQALYSLLGEETAPKAA